MATREELLAEAYRRGLMPPQQRAAYEEAQRRGIVKGPAGDKPEPSFSQAFFGKMGRDLVGMMNPALTPIVGPTIDRLLGPNTVRDFTQRVVQPITLNAADEAVSVVPAVAAARRGQSPKQAFSQSQRQQSQERQRIQRERPNLARAADVTGGAMTMAIPVPFAGNAVAAAPSLLQTALRTGGIGALQGGLTGFLGADEGQRMEGAGMGAFTGGTIGAVLPYAAATAGNAVERAMPTVRSFMQRAAPMVEDVGRAIPAVDDVAGNVAAAMRRMAPDVPQMASPDALALQKVQRTLQQSGLTLDDLANANPSLLAAEAMGPSGKRQLGTLARMGGKTPGALETEFATRRANRPEVLKNVFEQATGVAPDDARAMIDSVIDAGQRKAAPAYEAAFNDPIEMTDNLRGLLNRPVVEDARRRAYRLMKNDGLDPDALGFSVSPESGDLPVLVPTKTPSLRVLDYVKRGLDGELSKFRDKTTGRIDTSDPEARQLVGIIKEFRDELTNQSPNYRQALSIGSDYLSAQQAFDDAGRLLVRSNVNEKQFADALNRMGEGQRLAFNAGISNWAFDLGQTGKLDPKILKQPRIRAKLNMALGPERAKELIDATETEAAKLAYERRWDPNNSTLTFEAGNAADEMGVRDAAPMSPGTALMNPISSLKTAGAKGIDWAVTKTLQKLNPDAAAVRDEMGRLFMLSGQDLADYLAANPVNVPPPVFPGPRAPNPFSSLATPPRASSQLRR